MYKLIHHIKYNGIINLTRVLLSFIFGLLHITIKEINWYIGYLERFFKPSMRTQKIKYNRLCNAWRVSK